MVEKRNKKELIAKLIPRILKAALWGTLTYVFFYYLPMAMYPMELFPLEYSQLFYLFAGVVVLGIIIWFSGGLL